MKKTKQIKIIFRSIIIVFYLFVNNSYAQKKYKEVEGFYSLSDFETASGIYLLKNQTFFYFLSVGSLDLKIDGTYKLHNNQLFMYPNKKETKEFFVYGTTNSSKTDSIKLFYKKPYREEIENLAIQLDQNTIRFPEFSYEEDLASILVKRPKFKELKFEYKNGEHPELKKDFSIKITDSINEIRLFHNYYASTTKLFSELNYKMVDGYLIDDKQKQREKNALTTEQINKLIEFIDERKKPKVYIKDNKTYKELITINTTLNNTKHHQELENNNKDIIIKKAKFGKAFALSSNGISKIGNKNDFVEIEITNYIYERGSTSPFADESSSDDVQYILKVKTRKGEKKFSFYSSEINGSYTLNFEGYNVQILSDVYQHSEALIEMIINKKEK